MVSEINIVDERASNSQRYRILGKKGEGTFSEVLKCQSIKDGSFYAMKRMKQRYTSIDQINNLREIQAMRRLSPHNNIVELKEVLFNKKTGILSLICELMDQNLYELIRGRKTYLSESEIKLYMFQLCKSIEHLHKNGIFHRDVKPENVLLRDTQVKLGDFGSCRSVFSKQPYTEYISTRWYRAPECVLTDGYYNHKMDIWSIGCVMYEVMTLHPLFPGANEVDQVAKIHDVLGTPSASTLDKLRKYKSRSLDFNFPYKRGTGLAKMIPFGSQECRDLVIQLLVYDPDDRMSARQTLRHPFFKELRDAEKKNTHVKTDYITHHSKTSDDNERRKRKIHNQRVRPSYFTTNYDKVQDLNTSSNLNKAMKISSHPSTNYYNNNLHNSHHHHHSNSILPPIDSNKSPSKKKIPIRYNSGVGLTKYTRSYYGLNPNYYTHHHPQKDENRSIYDISHYLPSINKRLGGGGAGG